MKLVSLFFILFGVMSVSALPQPGVDDVVAEVEPIEPVEMKNETEVQKVELEHKEQVEVHHGKFRVRLKFHDDHTNNTTTTHKTRTRNRGGM